MLLILQMRKTQKLNASDSSNEENTEGEISDENVNAPQEEST